MKNAYNIVRIPFAVLCAVILVLAAIVVVPAMYVVETIWMAIALPCVVVSSHGFDELRRRISGAYDMSNACVSEAAATVRDIISNN